MPTAAAASDGAADVFVAEAFDYDVDWDDSTRTAIVNTKQSRHIKLIDNHNRNRDQEWSDLFRFHKVYTGGYHCGQVSEIGRISGSDAVRSVSLVCGYRVFVTLGSGVSDQSLSVSNSYLSKVRTGVNDGAVRIVCDLKAKISPEISYSSDGKTMTVAFPETYTASETTPSTPPSSSGGTYFRIRTVRRRQISRLHRPGSWKNDGRQTEPG